MKIIIISTMKISIVNKSNKKIGNEIANNITTTVKKLSIKEKMQ